MTLAPPAGYLSPAVRALARLHAFEPAGMAGTGAGGRVTLTDVLGALAPAGAAPSAGGTPVESVWSGDGLIETTVDVTGGARPDAEIATAVRHAAFGLHIGHDVPVSVAGANATRIVPPVPPGGGIAVGVGAPSWTATAALTATGERVLTSRLQRTVVVRWATREGRGLAEALLSAATTAVGPGPCGAITR